MQNNYKQVKLNLSKVGSLRYLLSIKSQSEHLPTQPYSTPQLSEPGDDCVHGQVVGQVDHGQDENEDHSPLDYQQVKF